MGHVEGCSYYNIARTHSGRPVLYVRLSTINFKLKEKCLKGNRDYSSHGTRQGCEGEKKIDSEAKIKGRETEEEKGRRHNMGPL